jgi:dTDP-4-dehydrorhamnose reductase
MPGTTDKPQRILLLGAGGQLGMVLKQKLAGRDGLISLTRAELDFSDVDAVRDAVRSAKPDVVINAAAYTAVDKAEAEPELCALVNASVPGLIAEEVAGAGGWLIHYSTDYVFDGSGTTPWLETDATGPLGVYGQTKLNGELAIAATGCRHVILRTSWVYAEHGRNFMHTMLRLGRERDRLTIVDDQIGAPTTAEAITEATLAVLAHLASDESGAASGTYHLTCAGQASWCDFAKAIFNEFGASQKVPEVVGIPTEAYPTPAKRPKNSRLNCEKFAGQFGFRMPPWQDALYAVASQMLKTRA